ncbi:hypothetical protein SAMN03159343_0255 [Klenkia marina]|uniref:Uncharacterized protein n=1 Tax=Klenkia marina TaxID=1960309 RepID=A0A1G4X9S4_9ACTN|nr:hypothetical protein [Klenkia marina]SCX37973.1 hypothetical protein SAMN03159343_0255 [Klenkia marina]
MRLDPTTTQALDQLRKTIDAEATHIRANRDLTFEARQRQIARSWVAHRDAAKALRERLNTNAADERRKLESDLFGLDGIVGWRADASTRATASVAMRDAQDRVRSALDAANSSDILKQHPEPVLAELLKRAERAGDEFMARAVAEAAIDRSCADVVNAFSAARPAIEPAVDRYWAIAHTHTRARDVMNEEMAFALEPPAEVAGLSEWEVNALAGAAVAL